MPRTAVKDRKRYGFSGQEEPRYIQLLYITSHHEVVLSETSERIGYQLTRAYLEQQSCELRGRQMQHTIPIHNSSIELRRIVINAHKRETMEIAGLVTTEWISRP
jgi:hypothetical protein